MSRSYKPWSPGQGFLLPLSPKDWLPEGHLVYFLLDVVDELDLSEIYDHYEKRRQGRAAYSPRMMTALLLYGYCVGVPSSRKIEHRTYEDLAFRVLTNDQHPDHSRINAFRKENLGALSRLFVQVLLLCQEAGLVRLGHVALDGSKFKANASKRKAMSYDRMVKEEERLQKLVEELLEKARLVDEAEDARFGAGNQDELPEDLRRAESRLEVIRNAKAALETQARQRKEEAEGVTPSSPEPSGEDDEDSPPPPAPELPSHKVQITKEGKPKPKSQRNFTDPESKIMKSSADGWVQAYNCQIVVDDEAQVIVAQAVTDQPPDCQHLRPLLDQVGENLGELPDKLSADSGYCSEANIHYAEDQLVTPYIATGRQRVDQRPTVTRGRPPSGLSQREKMARRLATKAGAAVYARRKAIVEPVFGQIKEARGLRRFLLRGLEKVRGEFGLIALTHNLLKLFRHRSPGPAWA